MTVITKGLSEKKTDNLEEPLVDNIVVEPRDEAKKVDIEGGYPIPPSSQRYIISARVRPYYSLMFILMLVLLVTTSLLGIFGTEYLYEQYRYLVGNEQKPEVYRAWGTLSFNEDPTAMAYESKVPARFEKTQESADPESIFSEFEQSLKQMQAKYEEQRDELLQRFGNNQNDDSGDNDLPKNQMKEESNTDLGERYKPKNVIQEEFELDLNNERYEKINVPSGGASRFIHDFYSNFTAIVDEKNQRCFVMPLDRSIILPPKSLYDLLFKMQDGYYSIDTERVRREMQVVTPAITDLESYGIYISKECQGFTSYKLEKFVGGVVKRSVSEIFNYQVFAGNKVVDLSIIGIPPVNVEVGPQALA